MFEFDFFNGTHFITFNLIECNEEKETVTVVITNQGKITQDTFALHKDAAGNLYFEYGLYYDKIYINDFTFEN